MSFTGLPGLRLLDLSHNIAFTPTANTFVNIGLLQTLILSHSNISDLAQAILTPLVSLTDIDLSHNLLVGIGSGLFNANKRLSSINLSHNGMEGIQYNTFDPLTSPEVRINLLGNVCTNQEFLVLNRNFDNIRNGLQECFNNFNYAAGHNIPKFAIIFIAMMYFKRFF